MQLKVTNTQAGGLRHWERSATGPAPGKKASTDEVGQSEERRCPFPILSGTLRPAPRAEEAVAPRSAPRFLRSSG
mgnify:CR=1 FL=1